LGLENAAGIRALPRAPRVGSRDRLVGVGAGVGLSSPSFLAL
jgi:hypothetical protein